MDMAWKAKNMTRVAYKKSICTICACKEPSSTNDFYCSYWDKRCSIMEKRISCPGFLHIDSFDNIKTIEEQLKEYEELIKEEGEP